MSKDKLRHTCILYVYNFFKKTGLFYDLTTLYNQVVLWGFIVVGKSFEAGSDTGPQDPDF